MKFLTSILIVLMLFLVGQPVCGVASHSAPAASCCEAGGDCADEQDPDAGRGDDCAGCNPFQNCSCCTAGIMLPAVPSFTATSLKPSFSKRRLFANTQVLHSTDPSGFWQPPRHA